MILVTGGAGFIGSVLVGELNKTGRTDIIIVDRLGKSDHWLNLRGLKYREYIHADELFTGAYDDIMEECSFIFHMGACSSTTETDMDFLFENNVNYSKSLFAYATHKKIPIVYASSAATYGGGEQGYDDDEQALDNLMPLNRYGYSKHLFDQWVMELKEKPEHWFGLKFFNVYGPNEYHKGSMSSLVYKAHKQIHETGKVKLFKSHKEGYKDGEQLRDFVYGVDIAKAMIELMDSSLAKHSGIYNMGTGAARSFYDLVAATFKALDKETNVEFIPMPDELRAQYQYYTCANMQKFEHILPGFRFKTIEAGVSDYVKNYLENDNPYFLGK
jgi:ADP-L-glycero-D-manno-heptose 6-epimerase